MQYDAHTMLLARSMHNMVLECRAGQASTVLDCLVQFNFNGTGADKSVDATRMENCLACLASHDIDIPLAFQVKFFREKCKDLVRFGQTEEFVSLVDIKDGFWQIVEDAEQLGVPTLVVEVIGDALLMLGRSCFDRDNVIDDALFERLAALVVGLASSHAMELDEQTGEQLKLLSILWDVNASVASLDEAIDELTKLASNSSYTGVLQPLLHDQVWPGLLQACAANGGEETACVHNVLRTVHVWPQNKRNNKPAVQHRRTNSDVVVTMLKP
jgi:hypothetical protein